VSTQQVGMPTGAQLTRFLYPGGPPWAKAIPTTPGETLILHGDPGSGLEEAGDWLAEATLPGERPVISLSVSLVADYETLLHRLVVATAVAAFGDEAAGDLMALSRGEQADLTGLAQPQRKEFLRLAATVTEGASGFPRGSVGRVLRLAPKALLAVPDAHLLTERWSRDVLWELRGAVQDTRRHSLVLMCPTEARESLSGPRAPFYGAGALADVGVQRDERFWSPVLRTHRLKMDREDLNFVLARTWGLARPTLAVLLDAQDLGARGSVERHTRAALGTVTLVMKLARTVNRYGPELLLRLSRGLPPYGMPSASARDVSRALRQLGFQGLVARVGQRGWRVADPFLSDALLSRPLSGW
jgi:hypothetical protein